MAAGTADRSGGLPGYYLDLHHDPITKAFRNLDDPAVFPALEAKVRDARTRNFVLDFSDESAYCGFDLDAESVRKLLAAPRPPELNVRWINVWLPHLQKGIIEGLAEQFEFSPRLLGFMLSAPLRCGAYKAPKRSRLDRIRRRREFPSESKSVLGGTVEDEIDLEDLPMPAPAEQPADFDFTKAMNQYSIANEVWHWSSVDWGRRFVCLGYNSLFPVAESQNTRNFVQTLDEDAAGDAYDTGNHELPKGKRVWSWLLLCEDRTVITISEDPFPDQQGALNDEERQSLKVIRRNLTNVFRNCSASYISSADTPAMALPIRRRVGRSREETAHRSSDIPGLLFYCLFDDWYGTYSIVFRQEHRYARELERLRSDMMRRADLKHVDRLHHIGRQLSVLRRVYQSYELIIDRVLAKQEASLESLKNSHVIPDTGAGAANPGAGPNRATADSSLESSAIHHASAVPESESLLGVGLSSAARVRFERLRHRIRLYALSEIEECMRQKDDLVAMNFNLIAIFESLSVQRLTRVTLLVAKLTVLFMPVSLMSAYFSSQLVDVRFTSTEYWQWFGIILGVSLVLLLTFSIVSGTMEGRMIYRPLGKRLLDWFGGKSKRRKRD